jgi:hypothetical protein
MTRYMSPDEAASFRKAAALVKSAQQALDAASAILLPIAAEALNGDVDDPRFLAWQLVADARDGLAGLPYRLAPQPEWTGGDSSRTRYPHL